jgi:cell division protein FtsL
MMRLVLLLLAAVLGSAFYLVHLRYESRTLYTALDKAQTSARKLETERDTLEVENRAQTAALRVQGIAHDQLGMRESTPDITQYVTVRDGEVKVSTPVATEGTASAPVAAAGRRVAP